MQNVGYKEQLKVRQYKKISSWQSVGTNVGQEQFVWISIFVLIVRAYNLL